MSVSLVAASKHGTATTCPRLRACLTRRHQLPRRTGHAAHLTRSRRRPDRRRRAGGQPGSARRGARRRARRRRPRPADSRARTVAPRDVNVIMRDYHFDPTPLYLYAGETVRLNVFNGGMVEHELVLGDAAVQAGMVRSRRRRDAASAIRHRATGERRSRRRRVAHRARAPVVRRASSTTCPVGRLVADAVPSARPPREGHGGRRRARESHLAKMALQLNDRAAWLSTRRSPDDVCDRRTVHRRHRSVVRRGLPGRLHPLRLWHRSDAVHRSRRVHRLRRVRARMPGQRDLPGGLAAVRVGQLHEHQRDAGSRTRTPPGPRSTSGKPPA